MKFEIRRAKAKDALDIYKLISAYASQEKLLKRSLNDIKKNLSSFFVASVNGKVVGCAGLDVYNHKLSEIRSLAVSPAYANKGIGSALVNSCVELAGKKKILEVMAITSHENFFKRAGFDYSLPGERKALFINPGRR